MNTRDIAGSLTTLFGELVNGAADEGGYMLNPGDEGLLRSLDKLTASEASALTPTGSSIAAHVDHVRYGLSLMNRWAGGDGKAFETAEWSASWRRTRVTDGEWQQLRNNFRGEATRWLDEMRAPRELSEIDLNGVIGSIGHLAYHLGAIRQINQKARGPREGGGNSK